MSIFQRVLLGLSLSIAILPAHALEVTKQADISFGTIDFEGLTGLGNITMGSNGTITYGSNTSGPGLGTPAQLQITGDVGTIVSISCSTSGNLVLAGHSPLQLSPIRFSIGSGNVVPYAMATQCAGIGIGVATHVISPTASENTIFVGGTLALSGQSLASGNYTTTGGGTLPIFQLLVQ